ncbi:GMP synthase (glutamine-hydrolyzing) [Nonomuraea sp. 3N208]|uniref:GMP synthase (glutamine-hydrolyzing) n=1 Tax=Nonomuraea sp. 3N208 TaxID=3457421 RepID=UPI003FCCEF36
MTSSGQDECAEDENRAAHLNEVREINRVVVDVTSKPPGNIEGSDYRWIDHST